MSNLLELRERCIMRYAKLDSVSLKNLHFAVEASFHSLMLTLVSIRFVQYSHCGTTGEVTALPTFEPWQGTCVVFLDKTLSSHGASLHPSV